MNTYLWVVTSDAGERVVAEGDSVDSAVGYVDDHINCGMDIVKIERLCEAPLGAQLGWRKKDEQ